MDAIKMSRVDFESGEADVVILTKSEVMSVWNRARAAQRRGNLATSEMVVKKALGLVQRPALKAEKYHEYGTTHKMCGCPAGQNGRMCYHRLAKMIEYRAIQRRAQAQAA